MTDRRTVMPPLTIPWFKTAMLPRFIHDGTAFYVLTPPRHRDEMSLRTQAILWVLFLGAVVGAPLWFIIK